MAVTEAETAGKPEAASFPWVAHYPPGVAWDHAIEMSPLPDLLARSVELYSDRPAMDFLDRKWSYGDLGDLVDRAAQGFQELGVKPGVHVGLFLPNCPYFVIAYYAILKVGGTVVNFNPLYAERELKHQVEDSMVEMMVTLDLKQLHDKMLAMLAQTRLKKIVVCSMAKSLPTMKGLLFPIARAKEVASIPRDDRHVRWESLIDNSGRPKPVAIDPKNHIAVLQYTGGTTGVPKGAMLTHANLVANVQQAALWFPGAKLGEEKFLGVIPFFHVFAMTAVMNFGLYLGAELILLPRFEIAGLLKAINDKKPTFFPAVPTIYTAINTHKSREKYNLRSIKYCVSGGAALPVEVKATFERLTGCKLVEGYGLSETSPVACVNPPEGVNKTASIGLPLPQTVIEIVSLEDSTQAMPIGSRGEVVIRGPQVMKGYWNKPEETQAVLDAQGRFRTGDVGYMDEDGYTFLVDRIKDIIIAGGYKLYPRHIEEAIYMHPAVEECIVGGIPDTYRGETVKAWIKLRAGEGTLTEEQLREFLGDKLSPLEMPKFIEFRADPLPKTMIGKLSRKALVDAEKAARAEKEAAVSTGAHGAPPPAAS